MTHARSAMRACSPPRRPDEPDARVPVSEDCLYLNVWRRCPPRGKLPVMVWIHGGSLVASAASLAMYDGFGTRFAARRGAVSINYRLGHLGYFGHPALTREAADVAVTGELRPDGPDRRARMGASQRRDLRWRPANVTIFGQSPADSRCSC